jgi:hypothetical protein
MWPLRRGPTELGSLLVITYGRSAPPRLPPFLALTSRRFAPHRAARLGDGGRLSRQPQVNHDRGHHPTGAACTTSRPRLVLLGLDRLSGPHRATFTSYGAALRASSSSAWNTFGGHRFPTTLLIAAVVMMATPEA